MPREADKQARRARIIAAAAELIVTRGPEALTMRKIAAEAGCTIGLINHWFDSKDELIEAVLDHASSTAIERSNEVRREPNFSPERALQQFLPLDEQRVKEQRVWVVFWALSIGRPGLRAGYARRLTEVRRQLADELRARGVPDAKVIPTVDLLMTGVDGIMANALAEPEYWTPKRQIDTLRRLLDLALDGA